MEYYKPFYDSNGFTYSCDMLRLTFQFVERNDEFQISSSYLLKYFENLYLADDLVIEHYDCFQSFKFRHLLKFVLADDVSFTVGIWFNGPAKDSSNKGFIEFNPNKVCGYKRFLEIFETIWINVISVNISRYDLAIDIPFDRNMIHVYRSANEKYQYMINKGSITEYLRCRNKHNFTKVYDKQKESGLDQCLTRVEITIEPGNEILYPQIYYYGSRQLDFDDVMEFDKLNSTYQVLVQLLQDRSDKYLFMRQLSRNTQSKIKPFISDEFIEFDKKLVVLL